MSNTVRIICGVHINGLVWLEKEWGPAVTFAVHITPIVSVLMFYTVY